MLFSAKIDTSRVEFDRGRVVGTFVIESNGQKFAEVTGSFDSTEDGSQFTENFSNNFSHPTADKHKEDLPRVRGLIQKFVSELLLQGTINVWISDVERSEGSNKMYEKLEADTRLEVLSTVGLNRLSPYNNKKEEYKIKVAE